MSEKPGSIPGCPTPRITLSNGHSLTWMVASGALGFDGRGWWWERPLAGFGLIKRELFTIAAKTVTAVPIEGNLKMWWPFNCIWPIKNGWVNKVGLTNPGIKAWYDKYGKKIHHCDHIIGSTAGNEEVILECIAHFNKCDLVGVEWNDSCPNHGEPSELAEGVVARARKFRAASRHPLLLKLSAAQPYVKICEALSNEPGLVEAVSFNSVPWSVVFPNRRTPLHRLEAKVGNGSGGVSGEAAQLHNWKAMLDLAQSANKIPIIGTSPWRYNDIGKLFSIFGARAIAFGSVHIGRPMAPTRWVQRWEREHKQPQPE